MSNTIDQHVEPMATVLLYEEYVRHVAQRRQAEVERMNSPLLLQQLAPIKRKIVAAFSESYQPRIRSPAQAYSGRPAGLRSGGRVILRASAQGSGRHRRSVFQDAVHRHRLCRPERLDHIARGRTTVSLSQCAGVVPLSLGPTARAVRHFRVDRKKSVTPLATHFRLADPRPFLAEAEQGIDAL